jgi:autotransporter-associated beta strand protein
MQAQRINKRRPGTLIIATSITALFAPFVVAPLAHAVDRNWDGDTDTTFSNAANWDALPANNTTSDKGIFGTSLTSFQPSLTADRSIVGLVFNKLDGGWTISGTGFILTTGGSGIVDNATSGTTNIEPTVGLITNTVYSTAGSTLNLNGGVRLGAGGTPQMSGTTGTINIASISHDGTTTRTLTKSNNATVNILGAAQSDWTGTVTLTGGILGVGNNTALGGGTLVLNGGNLRAITTDRALANVVRIDTNSTVSGTQSLTLNGKVTGNTGAGRQITNNIDSSGGKLLTLGDVDISNDVGITARNLTIAGTGNTTIAGTLANGVGTSTNNGLTITNTGVTTLSGTNTYDGNTSITGVGGRLVLAGDNTGATGNITFGNGTTVQASSLANFSAGSLLFNPGGTANKATLALRSNGNTSIAKDASWSGTNIAGIAEFNVDRATGGGPTGGTITWGNGGGLTFNNDNGQLLVTGDNGYGLTLNQTLTWGGNNQTNKSNIVNNAPGLLTLQGNISTTATATAYRFRFDGTGDILVNGTWTGGSSSMVNKVGTGTVTLANTVTPTTGAGTNRYRVEGGTLQLAVTAALNNSNTAEWTATRITVSSGATLAFNVGGTNEFTTGNITTLLTNLAASSSATNGMNAGSFLGFDTTNASGGLFEIADNIADTTGASGGARGLTKFGANTLNLTGTNTYTGATTISAGTLLVNGTNSGAGAVNVAALATLGGTGTISGLTTVASTGVLSPNTTGTIGTLTLNGGLTTTGASLVFDLSSPASNDKLDLGATGILTTTGGGNAFTFAGTPTAGTYTLIDYGTFTGAVGDFSIPMTVNGLTASLSNDTMLGAIVLTLTSGGGPDQWIGTGNWSAGANWQGTVPNSASAVASFLGMGTGAVTVDMPQTVGQLVFNAASPSYTIGGTSTLSVAGATPTITNTTGSNTITAPLNLANGTAITVTAGTLAISPTTSNTVGTGVTATVAASATLQLGGAGNALNSTTNITNAGTLSVTGTAQSVGNISGAGSTTVSGAGTSATPTLIAKDIDQASLTINDGAYVRLSPSGSVASVVTALNMPSMGTGILDITDNDVIVNTPNPAAATSTMTDVIAAVNGSRITTTASSGNQTVGFALNTLALGSFSGETVNADSVLIKYTYFGDSNLDGFVNDTDFSLFSSNYGTNGGSNPWLNGDYNHDGFVNDTDFALWSASYGLTPTLSDNGGIQAIPEPSTLVLGTLASMGLGALSLSRRRAKHE